jgi:beta-lactamase superfamily II metal-dependent hydrolase
MKTTRRVLFLGAAFIFLSLSLLAPGLPAAPASAASEETVRVFFLDVGQGDATLVQTSQGFEALVDGGRKSAGQGVLAFLHRRGVTELEALVATHADADHIGGLIAVLEDEALQVESVLYNGYPGDTQTWAEFVAAVQAEGLALVPAQRPALLPWEGLPAAVLNPPAGLPDPDQNQASIVLRLEAGPFHLLLPGDIDQTVEDGLLMNGDPLQADLLKVAHHGSQNSSSEAFLAAVDPAQAVISVGQNPYGHPDPEALARLGAIGAQVWRTDWHGVVVWQVVGESYTIYSENTFVPLAIRP